MGRVAESYSGSWRIVRRYWAVYGGCSSLLTSPYFHISLVLVIATYGTWTEVDWWGRVFSVLPNLLGFSLGGLAIFLGFGSEQFRNMISGREPDAPQKQSPYLAATAAFTHFIVVQVIALLVALVAAGLWKLPAPITPFLLSANEMGKALLWMLGYWLFLYAICSAAAALFAVFRVASWFDEFRTRERAAPEASSGAANVARRNEEKTER